MLRLDTPTRKYQIILGAAVATHQLPVVVNYSDKSATSYAGSVQRSLTNGTEAVDICAAPAASTIRDIDTITVVNTDTAAVTVTIRLDDNGTTAPVFSAPLSVGSHISYTHGQGFRVVEAGTPSSGNQNTLALTAGAVIAKDDMIEMWSDGKAYPVTEAVGAVVANKGSNVFGETYVTNGNQNAGCIRNAALKDAGGDLYVIANTGVGYGIGVYKYSPAGVLLASVGATELGTSPSDNIYSHNLRLLSNGNILVVFKSAYSVFNLKFAILSKTLGVIKTATNVGSGSFGGVIGVTTLSGGGFAVAYDNYSDSTKVNLDTFDNAGGVVKSYNAIGTKTSDSANCYVAELSNGNLVVCYSNASGQFYGVFTPAGAVIKAFTSVSGRSGIFFIDISVIAGTFCFAAVNMAGNGVELTVCNNAGTILGTQTLTSSPGGSNPYYKLMNNGSDYYAVYSNSATSSISIAKVPVTGASMTSADFSSTGYGYAIDAYISGENFVWGACSSASTAYYGVAKLTGVVITPCTALGTVGGSGQPTIALVNGGSSTMIAYWSWNSTSSFRILRKKIFDTALIGVADAAASAGQQVSIKYAQGAYRINALNILTPLAFDHSSASIPGNKGTLLPLSAALKGF